MNTLIYVNGGILIKTPFFKYSNAGCYYNNPPEGAEIIEANNIIDGVPCIIITEKNAPSFFKEYYAKTEFTTLYDFAPFFKNTLQDCHKEFCDKIGEIYDLIRENDVSKDTRQNLYRLSLVAVVSALDSYISGIVLFAATKDRNIFLETARKYCKNKASDIISRITKMWCDNIFDSAEQEVVDEVLKTSYSNLKRINDDVLKSIYCVALPKNVDISDILNLRHIIVHRNGKRKDGKEEKLDKASLITYIKRVEDLELEINNIVTDSKIYALLK